jgi:uncharacterized protein (DUF697 family)
VLCQEKAQQLVHKYAAFGTAWAVLPIPIATSPGLTALETHMAYWIARTYGESPSHTDTMMMAAGLELGSVGLKTLATNLANLVPVIGWGIKGAIAALSIEGLGAVVIRHFESKYPGKTAA